MLSAEQISTNLGRFYELIEAHISEPRATKLLALYQGQEELLALAPASSKASFHNSFPGGYVDHVIRVTEAALVVRNAWESMGATINFTEEELVFSALNHDLGKIGFKVQPNFLPQTDKWRQDKLGELYTPNKDLSFMLIQDRSLFLLQQNGIQMDENEYLAIKLHDGLYDDVNKPYYITFNPDSKLRTNIVYILHQAYFLASKIEYDRWKSQDGKISPSVEKTTTSTGKKVNASEGLMSLVKNI